MNSHNIWLCDRWDIGIEFESYFSNIFTRVHPSFPNDLQGLIGTLITDGMNQELIATPTLQEIQQAFFRMGNYKSPGPDGMTVTFYKHYWGIVGLALVIEIQNIFTTGRIKPALNHTFIALIPKTATAHKVEQYRPIALCNVIFKAITKIIS